MVTHLGGEYMFEIGDKIVYPLHGVGVVEAIEEKEVLGKNRVYYIMKIPQTKMQIMIPIDKVASLGIRQVVEPTIIDNVLQSFQLGNTDPTIYENHRYCSEINKKRIKSGDIYKGTEIIRDLMRKNQRSKLGKDDTNMLNNARQMFISEIMQVKCITQEQALDLLEVVLNPSAQ